MVSKIIYDLHCQKRDGSHICQGIQTHFNAHFFNRKDSNHQIFEKKIFFENFSTQKFKFRFKILKKPEKTPNILTNHVRYSSNISLTIPNAKYISILRDPIGHFISTFEYFHHIGVFNTLERGEKGLYQESLKIRALRTGTARVQLGCSQAVPDSKSISEPKIEIPKSFSKIQLVIIKMTQGGASGSPKI